MTTIALDKWPGLELAVALVATARAAETLRPARLEQGLTALRLRSESLKELVEAEAFLKLDFELTQDVTPSLSVSYETTTRPYQ